MPVTKEITDREAFEQKRYDRYLVEKDDLSIIKQEDYYIVSNKKNSSIYRITKGEHGFPSCNCADFVNRGSIYAELEEDKRPGYCKHIHSVVEWAKLNRGFSGNGSPSKEELKSVTEDKKKEIKEEKKTMCKPSAIKNDKVILDILGDSNLKTKQRQGPGGRILDYIDVPEAKRLMDSAFGLNWNFEILSVQAIGGIWLTQGRITVKLDDGRIIFRDGIGTEVLDKKASMTPDLTLKSAVSDAFKLCCKYFGVGMFLYNKDFTDNNSGNNGNGRSGHNKTGNTYAPQSTQGKPGNGGNGNGGNGSNGGNGKKQISSEELDKIYSRW